MNVLVLGWEYPPAVAGGLGAACHGLTTALARSGARVTLAVPGVPGDTAVAVDGPVERVEIDVAPGPGGRPRLYSPYGATPAAAPEPDGSRAGAANALYGGGLGDALAAYVRGVVARFGNRIGAFDVIHAHDWMTIPAAMELRVRLRVPVCLHIHSTAFDRAGVARAEGPLVLPHTDPTAQIEAAGIRAADRVIAVSEFTRSVIERGYGVGAPWVEVVHNARPVVEAAREPAPAAPALTAGPDGAPERTVLFVGRLTRQKGASYFLRAAARAHALRGGLRFVVVGDGDERKALIEEAASLGLGRTLFFTGSIDDAARDRAYTDADLYVMTSLSEPFGLTPLEALDHGAAVILPNAAGVAEVLTSAPRVDPWDVEALAAEIVRLADDDVARAALVEAGLAESATLTWDDSGAELARILGEASAA